MSKEFISKIMSQNSNFNYDNTTLDNGLRVVTGRLPYTNAVSVNLLFGAGSRYESDELAGISHLFEHMLFKGTVRRQTPREISEIVEGVGGTINAFTDRELTGYWCRIAQPYYEQGLEVLIDMIRGSLLRDEDIVREKQVVYEEIRATNDSPAGRAGMMLEAEIWPSQPLGRDIAGTEQSVSEISRESMVKYLKSQYVASNTVISVAGNVEHNRIVNQISELMGDFSDGSIQKMFPFRDNLKGPSVRLEFRPTEQAHIAIGIHGLSMNHADRHALGLLSVILGESMSSRLFEEIRERRGLAYDIHSSTQFLSDTGALFIECGIDPKRVREAVPLIIAELSKVRNGVTDKEILQAKELSKGRIMLRMEESRAVSGFLGAQVLLKGEIKTVDNVISEIFAVEKDDIARVAENLIRPEKLGFSVVGPFEKPEIFLSELSF